MGSDTEISQQQGTENLVQQEDQVSQEDEEAQGGHENAHPEEQILETNDVSAHRREIELLKLDSFDLESGKIISTSLPSSHHQGLSWETILKLAFQSIGIVYGDIGTSPLYVLPAVFANGIADKQDILGVLSLIIYSITLITVIKYVFIVLLANDNGNGGTFALYSLICRYAKVSFMPNQQAEDTNVSNYRLDLPNRPLQRASALRSFIEKSQAAKYVLLLMAMLGTAMVLGDGILTPCISVLSAVSGLKEAHTSLTDKTVMWISVAILILLFQIQRFGTDKVGYSFAPIITIWFTFIGTIGLFNLKYDPGVIKALNPAYIIYYFQRNGKIAWISLGGVVLSVTGSEALFADLGHFNVRSIQISTCVVVFPTIIMAYTGQASYLMSHPEHVASAFYSSIPKPVYWPMFAETVMAAIIASQSLISAAFSIVQQSVSLGCFPRVKIIHTSSRYKGQVYIPEINTLLMLACVFVTLGFKNTVTIGNAYGLAVVLVYTVTSIFLILIMIMIWKTRIVWIITYVFTIGLVELLYLSSVLYKFPEGGYLPLAFSTILVIIMYTWNYGCRMEYTYELRNKVSTVRIKEIASDPSIHRVPGLALFCTEMVQGIPPIFIHYVTNVSALHSVLVFVTIKSLPISKVDPEEQYLFKRLQPRELAIFRCVVRYGYTDTRHKSVSFEDRLLAKLKDFITYENSVADGTRNESAEREAGAVACDVENGGVVYLMGGTEVLASAGSGFWKKLAINHVYNWLRRCVRQEDEVFMIPKKRLLKVGMTCDV